MRRLLRWVWEKLTRWATMPCPKCGSRDHEEVRRICDSCGEVMDYDTYKHLAQPRCGHCGCKHVPCVLQCNQCDHEWMPRRMRRRGVGYE